MTLVHALLAILQEALDDLRRSPAVNTISILIMAVSLTLVGAFFLVSENARSVLDAWTSQVRVDVFLRDEATPEVVETLSSELAAHPLVARVGRVTREEALEEFRRLFPDLSAVPEELGGNPFPASLRATLVQPPPSVEQLGELARTFAARAGVEDVRYDQSWIQKLSDLVYLFSVGALVVGGILSLAALFTMSSVIRLNVYARQEEIALQRLVGATANFIRGPFVAQGMLQGLVGAGIALIVLFAVQTTLSRWGSSQGNALLLVATERPLSLGATLLLLGLGALIGLIGSVAAVRRFLKL